MTTFTREDVAAQRDRVRQLETQHAEASAAANQWLADVRSAVENDGADRPAAETVAEQFADADRLASQIDSERAQLARMYESRNGTDAGDQRPGTDAAAFLQTLGIVPGGQARNVDAAATWLADDRVAAAMASGDRDAITRIAGVELLSAERFITAVGGPMAATTDGSAFVPDDQSRVGQLRGLPVRQPVLLDWVRLGTTDSDSVPYTRQTVETSNFTDGNPLTSAEAVAGEATITYTPASEEIVDRRQGLPVPDRNLADAGRMRSILNGRLIGMARRDLEAQLIAGAGGAGAMTGITNWSGVNTYTRVTGDSIADAIYKGITAVRTTLLEEPTGIAHSANDLQKIVLEKASDGHYVNSTGPFGMFAAMMWMLPATVAHVLGAEQSIVGKWDEDELVVRQGPTVREFDSHDDYAAKGLVYMRTQYRATNIIERAQAFAVVTTTDPV